MTARALVCKRDVEALERAAGVANRTGATVEIVRDGVVIRVIPATHNPRPVPAPPEIVL